MELIIVRAQRCYNQGRFFVGLEPVWVIAVNNKRWGNKKLTDWRRSGWRIVVDTPTGWFGQWRWRGAGRGGIVVEKWLSLFPRKSIVQFFSKIRLSNFFLKNLWELGNLVEARMWPGVCSIRGNIFAPQPQHIGELWFFYLTVTKYSRLILKNFFSKICTISETSLGPNVTRAL